jgi:hypothetical protein
MSDREPRGRARAALAVGLWAGCVGLLGATTAVIVSNLDRGDRLDLAAVAVLVFVLSCSSVGAIVALRRPGLPAGWLLETAGLGYAVAGFATSAVPLIHSPHAPLLYLDVIARWLWPESVTLIGVFLLLRFPDGLLVSRRWRIVEWATGLSLVVAAIGVTVKPGRVEGTRFTNPLRIPGSLGKALGSLEVAYAVAFFAVFVSFASVLIRYRRSKGPERDQLKWILYAAVVILAGALVEFALPDLVANQDTATNIGNFVSTLAISFLPIAIGIAVLRHRLWDIDRLINRTIVYALLSVLLVGLYAALVVGLGAVSGRTGNPVLIAGSTLVVAALFGPARRRIQVLIDRRFYRRRYDSDRVLAAFSARLRDELDLASLSGELRLAAADAVQPSLVAIWIRGMGEHA